MENYNESVIGLLEPVADFDWVGKWRVRKALEILRQHKSDRYTTGIKPGSIVPVDQMPNMVKQVARAIGLVFIPDGIYNIEEGFKLEQAARSAIEAMGEVNAQRGKTAPHSSAPCIKGDNLASPSTMGKRVMYSDGTPSREYEENE